MHDKLFLSRCPVYTKNGREMGKISELVKERGRGGGEMMYSTSRFSTNAYLGVVITVMENAKRYSVQGSLMRKFETVE